MKPLAKTLLISSLAGAGALPPASAQAWWSNPGWGGPWGYREWTDGMGDLLAHMWGDVDFSVHFSLRGLGHGYGRGYGDYYNNYHGYGYHGYPGSVGAYPAPWGGYPAYYGAYPHRVSPTAAPPVTQPSVVTARDK
jgi:hypothetical protein